MKRGKAILERKKQGHFSTVVVEQNLYPSRTYILGLAAFRVNRALDLYVFFVVLFSITLFYLSLRLLLYFRERKRKRKSSKPLFELLFFSLSPTLLPTHYKCWCCETLISSTIPLISSQLSQNFVPHALRSPIGNLLLHFDDFNICYSD